MRHILTFLFFVTLLQARAQQTISGTIRDWEGNAIANANVFLEGSYEGTISDTAGNFHLITSLDGEQLLRVSFIGYRTFSRLLYLHGRDTTLSVTLVEEPSELDEVTITAGTFSASDKRKSATLTSFDITTTASAMGDIYGAYATMPGSQKVGEDGMLFVRGGESYETRTYMDGLLVQSPYFAKLPDIPTRGRYSPLLFSETTFSTGGYSAEFGQALSSVVDLRTNGLESKNKTSVSLMSVGASASMGRRWEKTSLALTGVYANNALQNRLFKQTVDWISDPVMADGTLMYQKQIREKGLLKAFCSYNINGMEMNYDNFAEGTMDYLRMKNRNFYANTSYSEEVNEHWHVRTGMAWSRDMEYMIYRDDPIRTEITALQAKLVLGRKINDRTMLDVGADLLRETWGREVFMDSTINLGTENLQAALFAESEMKLAEKIALRAGLRGEFSSLLSGGGLSPRLSAAWKTGSFSQLSLAWGLFSQHPLYETMAMAPQLAPERATHYILNFQYRKDRRMFRAEAYLKRYSDLVKYHQPYSTDPGNYSNEGSGYARGADLFWRDRASIRNLDYWVSYSYLDTRRDYRNFPSPATPAYASAHNLSVVAKYFFDRIRTFTGFTYSFASPRPYDDKNSIAFMDGRTPCYNDLSLSLTHVTGLWGSQLVIHITINNLLGSDNIFGYDFALEPGPDGRYASRAIVPTTGTQAILVLLISF
jgi:outer membrane cobalamin receptor